MEIANASGVNRLLGLVFSVIKQHDRVLDGLDEFLDFDGILFLCFELSLQKFVLSQLGFLLIGKFFISRLQVFDD